MAEPGRGVERELEESVRRVLGALERVPAARLGSVAAQVSRAAETAAAGIQRSAGREATSAERRLEKRFREEDEASIPHAFVLGGAAVVGRVRRHHPAAPLLAPLRRLRLRHGGGRHAREGPPARPAARGRGAERRRRERPLPGASSRARRPRSSPLPPPAPPESPVVAAITARESRVDGICDRLLAELKGAPPLVRELLRKPEETVEALRAASRELARRERNLRTALTEDEGAASRPRADRPLGARRVDVRRRREGTPRRGPRGARRAAHPPRRALDRRRADRGGGDAHPLLAREPSRPGPARAGGRLGRVGRDAREPEGRARDAQRARSTPSRRRSRRSTASARPLRRRLGLRPSPAIRAAARQAGTV